MVNTLSEIGYRAHKKEKNAIGKEVLESLVRELEVFICSRAILSTSWKSVAAVLVSNWVCGIQTTKQVPPSTLSSLFSQQSKYISPIISIISLYLDVPDLHAHSLITSSGATICKSTPFPCFAFLSLLEASCTSSHGSFSWLSPACPVWPAVCIAVSPG